MYTLATLLEDVAQKRGRLLAKECGSTGPLEYSEVWNAFTAYVKACLSERRGLHLPQLCRIGWRVDRKSKGNASYRPFFQLTDQFCQQNLSEPAYKKHKQQAIPEADMVTIEEFNYSKAAIKYSQQLTKDQMFTGLRAIAQRIGELVGEGKDGDISFGDCGHLRCGGGAGKEPSFTFSGVVYAMEGQQPPPALAPVKEDTSVAFSRDMPKEAMGLGIRGNTVSAAATDNLQFVTDYQQGSKLTSQPAARGVAEEMPTAPVADTLTLEPAAASNAEPPSVQAQQETPPRRLTGSASAPQLPTNTELKQGFAYKEAMERHVRSLEERAQEVVAEHDAWHSHVAECLEQEREEILAKRFRAKDNLTALQDQMQKAEERKKSQRKVDIEAASAHEFPIMQGQAKEESKKELAHGMQERLRADLDAQVRTNNTLRNIAKQRERALEIDHLESLRSEMTHLRGAERAKRAYEKEALSSAWNSDVRLHNIMKAIDNHGKSKSAVAMRAATPLQPVTPLNAAASQVLMPGLPELPRGTTPMSSAGRLMTGSQRRVPMGASNSLSRLQPA